MNKKTNLITKRNDLINASYNLSIQEVRLLGLMTTKIHPNDSDFLEYTVKISEFAELLDIKGNWLYDDIKKVTRRLLSRVLTVYTDNSLLQIGWLSSAEYFEGQGIVKLCFDPKMKPYLLQLKEHFTSYKLSNVVDLKSQYAYRIYEMLKQYQTIGRRIIELKNLRWYLKIENKFERWSDFKRYVLDIAEREINEKTDINIYYTIIKTGRKITSLDFKIKTSKTKESKTAKNINTTDSIIELVPESYRSLTSVVTIINKYINKYDINYVKRNIKYTNNHASKNYVAYLKSALKEDWGLQEEEGAIKHTNSYSKALEEFRAKPIPHLKQLAEAGNVLAKKVLEERSPS